MRRILAVCTIALAAAPASAFAGEAPPGAVISDSLDYVKQVPSSSMIVEGKFDRVRGRKVLLTTGRYASAPTT